MPANGRRDAYHEKKKTLEYEERRLFPAPSVKVRANRRFIFVQVSSFIDSNTIQAYFDN